MGFWSNILNIFKSAAETVATITVATLKAEAQAKAAERIAENVPEEYRAVVTQIVNETLNELVAEVTKVEARYFGRKVPRPSYWSGYRVVPVQFDFWQARAFRLHDRTIYELIDGEWRNYRVYP